MYLKYSTVVVFYSFIFLLTSCTSPNNNKSPTAADIFTPRFKHKALSFDDKIWVIGGSIIKDATIVALNDVWFSDGGRAWQQATADASWRPRNNFGAVVFKDKMYLLGGSINDSTIDNFNDIWSSTNGRDWHLVTSNAAWSPRGSFDPFVFEGKIWVVGGVAASADGFSAILKNDVWSSDNGRAWQLRAENTTNDFAQYEAVVFEDKVWIIDSADSNVDIYAWYSSDGINYTKSHVNNLASFTSVVFQNKIWILGGSINSSFNFNTELISFTSASDIQTFTPNWHPRFSHASVVFKNKIWVLGGLYSTSNSYVVFNDVWSWDNTQSDWTQER